MNVWRILLTIAVVILGVSVMISLISALGYDAVSIDASVSNVKVKYFKHAFAPQVFRIVVSDSLGRKYPTTLSLYMWMPNGSVIEVGKFLGKRGNVDVSLSRVIPLLKEWYNYLTSQGNDPRLVKPGILILGAIHTPRGVYGIVKGIPLDIVKILNGLSVEIEIVENIAPENILITPQKVKELARLARTLANANTTRSSSSWPPGEMEDYCDVICDEFGCIHYCFIWKLEKVHASALNKGAPLVVAYVYGDAEKVNDVLLREYFEAKESKGIEVAFGITASVKKGNGEISYSIPGFTVELGGENHIWLDSTARFFEGRDFGDDAILAIGIRGDFAFAKYKLQYCIATIVGWICIDTDEEANMTLARPVIQDNKILTWKEVDANPYDGVGIAEKAFKYISRNWEWSPDHIEYGGIYIDAFDVSEEIKTHPLFSTSISILPLILGELPEGFPLAVVASATVGLTEKETTKMMVACDISIQKEYASDTYVWANYLYSPTQFKYKGDKYYIGSLYIDALVSS